MLSTQFLKTRLIESDSFRNLSECEVKELTSSSLLDGYLDESCWGLENSGTKTFKSCSSFASHEKGKKKGGCW